MDCSSGQDTGVRPGAGRQAVAQTLSLGGVAHQLGHDGHDDVGQAHDRDQSPSKRGDGESFHETSYLRSIDGHNIKLVGRMNVAGKDRKIMKADFTGLAGKWSIEQVCFAAKGYVWRLTASWDPKVKSLLPTMLHMLKTFKLTSGA